MQTVPTPTPFEGLAAELAAAPGLIDALLAAHVPDARGYCRTCTAPRVGTHTVRMPCSLRQLAEYAAVTVGGS